MDWDEQDMSGEDGGVHTVDHPYCDDLACWCHCDVGYHELVMHPGYSDSDLELAYGFYAVHEEGR